MLIFSIFLKYQDHCHHRFFCLNLISHQSSSILRPCLYHHKRLTYYGISSCGRGDIFGKKYFVANHFCHPIRSSRSEMFFKTETLTQVFPCEYFEIFKIEQLWRLLLYLEYLNILSLLFRFCIFLMLIKNYLQTGFLQAFRY